jgi:hypothetical protein
MLMGCWSSQERLLRGEVETVSADRDRLSSEVHELKERLRVGAEAMRQV